MPCQKETVNRFLLNDFKVKPPNFSIDEKSLMRLAKRKESSFVVDIW